MSNQNKIVEREYVTPKNGYLYDAIASVERAEQIVRGNTVNTWLYSRLYEIQLRICYQINLIRKGINDTPNSIEGSNKFKMFSRCRNCNNCGNKFNKYLNLALTAAVDDEYRLARCVNIAMLYVDLFKENHQIQSSISKSINMGAILIKSNYSMHCDRKYHEAVKSYIEGTILKINGKKYVDIQ